MLLLLVLVDHVKDLSTGINIQKINQVTKMKKVLVQKNFQVRPVTKNDVAPWRQSKLGKLEKMNCKFKMKFMKKKKDYYMVLESLINQ